MLFRFLAKFLSPVNCVFKSLELLLRGTCLRGALFGEVSAGKKKEKKMLEFLFVRTGGAGRDKKEVKGRGGEGRGGVGGFENASCAICYTSVCRCCSLLLLQQTRTKKIQKQKKTKKQSSTENSSSSSPPPPPPPLSALPCSGCNQNLGFLMADCLSAAVDLVIRTDGHQLGNHKIATIAPIRCSFRISSSSPSSSCSSEFSCSFSCFLTTS